MGMAHASDVDLLVLLALRLRTLADVETVAAASGLTVDEAGEALRRLGTDGLVRSREGRVSGWMLTAAGRDVCGAELAAELDAAGVRDRVAGAYVRFLGVNQPLLDLCTRWQIRTTDGDDVVNDHTDASYDAAVLAGLVEVDGTAQAVCRELGDSLARFDSYGPRLAAARAATERGEPDWLTRPTIDSYHTVWFELHENLLASLGRERGDEALAPSSLQEAR